MAVGRMCASSGVLLLQGASLRTHAAWHGAAARVAGGQGAQAAGQGRRHGAHQRHRHRCAHWLGGRAAAAAGGPGWCASLPLALPMHAVCVCAAMPGAEHASAVLINRPAMLLCRSAAQPCRRRAGGVPDAGPAAGALAFARHPAPTRRGHCVPGRRCRLPEIVFTAAGRVSARPAAARATRLHRHPHSGAGRCVWAATASALGQKRRSVRAAAPSCPVLRPRGHMRVLQRAAAWQRLSGTAAASGTASRGAQSCPPTRRSSSTCLPPFWLHRSGCSRRVTRPPSAA